ncbi:hypothetical protein ACTWX2_002646, partial [Acinetobacter baumannii]
MKHLPSENAAPMAVGIQFSVGLSALGCELNQIKQALQQPQQTLSLRDDLIADRDVWVGQYTHPLCSSGHCCKVSDEAAFCLIQRPYISKTLLTRRISPRGSP